MNHLMYLLFAGTRHFVSVAAKTIGPEVNHSFPSFNPIQERWDLQRTSERFDGQWVALGDSFSAGPGAGSNIDIICGRSDGGYPQQLQSEKYWPATLESRQHPLQFLSCTGAVVSDVTKKQSPQMLKLGHSKLITLSVGGNDVLMSRILLRCIANLGDGTCDEALSAGRELLYGRSLWDKYQTLVYELLQKTSWVAMSVNERRPLIYHTAYPAFFDAKTTQCNEITFNPRVGSSEPKLTQALRRKVNGFVAEFDVMIAFWITHMNQQYDNLNWPNNTSPISFVDQDTEYTGHRFCKDGVTEPDTKHPDTWFFHMKNAKSGAKADDFSEVDISTCLTTAGDRIDLLYKCYISKEAARTRNYNFSALPGPDSQISGFSPTAAGMGGVAKVVSEAMRSPVKAKQWLKILATGDSITRGSGSPSTGGYRGYLNDLLSQEVGKFEWVGSQTNGTKPDLDVVQLPHEGYGGYTTRGLAEVLSITNSSLDRKPNLVLLMIGTNDINRNATVLDTTTGLEELVNLIWLRSGSDTLIIVSTIVPIGPAEAPLFPMGYAQRRVMEYNSQLKNLVNEMRTAGKNIELSHTAVSQYDRYDTLHPNPRGYEKMAHVWFEAIMRATQNGQIPKRLPPASVEDAPKDEPKDIPEDAPKDKPEDKPSSSSLVSPAWLSMGWSLFCLYSLL